MSTEIAALVATIAAAVSACASLLVAIWSLRAQRSANRISGSDPWAALLMRHLEDEILAADEQRTIFLRFCELPFRDVPEKHTYRERLDECRDASNRRIHLLSVLCSDEKSSSCVQSLRDARTALDKGDDSYFSNGEINLDRTLGASLAAKYDEAHRKYVLAARGLINTLNQRG